MSRFSTTLRCAALLAATALSAHVAPAAANCIQLEGALQQGGFIWGSVPPGSTVTLDGKPLDVLEDGTTLSLIHISEPTRLRRKSRMPSSA